MTKIQILLIVLASAFAGAVGGYFSSGGVRAQAQAESDVITVRELRLVDRGGVLRARLGPSRDSPGQIGLLLYDTEERERMRFVSGGQGNGGMTLHDSSGDFRLGFTLSAAAIPGLTMTAGKGKIRTLLLVDSEGVPQLELYGSHNQAALRMEVGAEGDPVINLRKSFPGISSYLRTDGLQVASQDGTVRGAFRVDEKRGGRLVVWDAQGQSKSLP